MSPDFVRYSPEVETIDPKLNEYMTRIIDFWEQTVHESPEREGSAKGLPPRVPRVMGELDQWSSLGRTSVLRP